MTTLLELPKPAAEPLPPLRAGERLGRAAFHARYEAMGPEVRAELIGGVVHMPSPMKRRHGRGQSLVNTLLGWYAAATPGVQSYSDATVLLGPDAEPQPDGCLLIAPERGGQTGVEDDYIVGAPELVVEVGVATTALDLGARKRDYERYGVREYLVVLPAEGRAVRHGREGARFVEAAPDAGGLLRSVVFPGLWLDAAALAAGDAALACARLREGLASPEHAAFVAQLAGGGA